VLPSMESLYTEYGGTGADDVRFLGVSVDTLATDIRAAINKYGLEYPQVSNLKSWKTSPFRQSYGLSWIPTFYVIDPEGRVALSTVTFSKLEAYLEKLR